MNLLKEELVYSPLPTEAALVPLPVGYGSNPANLDEYRELREALVSRLIKETSEPELEAAQQLLMMDSAWRVQGASLDHPEFPKLVAGEVDSWLRHLASPEEATFPAKSQIQDEEAREYLEDLTLGELIQNMIM